MQSHKNGQDTETGLCGRFRTLLKFWARTPGDDPPKYKRPRMWRGPLRKLVAGARFRHGQRAWPWPQHRALFRACTSLTGDLDQRGGGDDEDGDGDDGVRRDCDRPVLVASRSLRNQALGGNHNPVLAFRQDAERHPW